MIINGKHVCVRDGEWKSCEVRTHLVGLCVSTLTDPRAMQGGHAPADFIRQIEEEYNKLNEA